MTHTSLRSLISTDVEFRHVKIDRYDIQYAVAGQGRPMVLIHGANIGWSAWYANIKDLSQHFKLYMIDLPGCGESTRVDFTQVDFERDFVGVVAQFLDQLDLEELPVVVGHSLSGWIVLKLALQNQLPKSQLVLINAMGFSRHIPMSQKPVSIRPLAKLLSKTALKPVPEKMAPFFESVMAKHDYITAEFLDYYCKVINKLPVSHPLMLIHSLTSWFKIKKFIDLREQVDQLKNDVLIIHGELDPLTKKSQVDPYYRKIPNATIKYLPEVGHAPHMEDPSQFFSILQQGIAAGYSQTLVNT